MDKSLHIRCLFRPESQLAHNIIASASAPPLSLPVLASCTLCRRSRRDTHDGQWTVGSCDVLWSWQEHIYYLLACGDVCCDVETLRIISAFGNMREYHVLLTWMKFYIGICNDWTNQNIKHKMCTAFNVNQCKWPMTNQSDEYRCFVLTFSWHSLHWPQELWSTYLSVLSPTKDCSLCYPL